MSDEDPLEVVRSFTVRAASYDRESPWISDPRLIRPLVNPPFGNRRLLDACAGTGSVATYAQERGWRTMAFDITKDMLTRVTSTIPVLIADIHQLPFPDGTFDAVVCRQGLHYADLERALAELGRVCSGQLSIGEITLESLEDRDFWRDYFAIVSPGRRRIFGPGELARAIKRKNMTLVSYEVRRTRGTLGGSIAHLEPVEKHNIRRMFENAPRTWKARYYPVAVSGGDIEYTHRWEFVTVRLG